MRREQNPKPNKTQYPDANIAIKKNPNYDKRKRKIKRSWYILVVVPEDAKLNLR